MPVPKSAIPQAAQPRFGRYDVWNSSATGHQRAEQLGMVAAPGWRQARSMTGLRQLKGREGLGDRIVTAGEGGRGDTLPVKEQDGILDQELDYLRLANGLYSNETVGYGREINARAEEGRREKGTREALSPEGNL